MHTTLKDIAKATGFSINTISRALKNDQRLSEQTLKIIQSTAKEMNYVPNSLAYSLRKGNSKTISIIAGDISNPYFSIFIKGVESYVAKLGYTVIVLNSNENEDRELAAIKTSLNKKVDGILICPVQKSDTNILYLQTLKIPYILFGRKFSNIQTNYIIPDEKKGGYLATKYLLDNCHKDIMFLMASEYISSSPERLEGSILAFNEAKLPFPQKNIYHFDISEPNLFNRIISGKLSFDSVTAVFCFSDVIAQECIYALRTIGKKVPQDISVIGFDDIQSNFLLAISVTSIKITDSIALCASKKLLSLIENENELTQIVLDVKLSYGETVTNI